jgi:hypothetical protein
MLDDCDNPVNMYSCWPVFCCLPLQRRTVIALCIKRLLDDETAVGTERLCFMGAVERLGYAARELVASGAENRRRELHTLQTTDQNKAPTDRHGGQQEWLFVSFSQSLHANVEI